MSSAGRYDYVYLRMGKSLISLPLHFSRSILTDLLSPLIRLRSQPEVSF